MHGGELGGFLVARVGTAMTKPKAKSGLAAVITSAAILGVVASLLYVLSIGPVIWLMNREYLPREAAFAYVPIFYLCELLPVLKTLLQLYVDWWTIR
jgi:hypothetical protein